MREISRRGFVRQVCIAAGTGTLSLLTSTPFSGTRVRAATPAPRGLQSLNVALASDIVSLDPHVSQTTFFRMINTAIFENLVNVDPETLEVVPSLAQSIRQLSPTMIEFKLREGVTFHSGDIFTAADVKYSLERVLTPKTGSPLRLSIGAIEKIEVIDKFSVRITLSQPDPGFLTALHKIGFFRKPLMRALIGSQMAPVHSCLLNGITIKMFSFEISPSIESWVAPS